MGEFLMKAKKADLIYLAEELGEVITNKSTMIDLSKIIQSSQNYDETLVKSLLESIIAERKEREENEREEKKLAREHELKLKEIESNQLGNHSNGMLNENNSSIRMPEDGLIKYLNLVREQLPTAPEKPENWVFFFHQMETIFEIYGVPNEFWGKIVLNKLSHLMKNLTNNLGIEKLTEYKSIKECILAENSLTPLQHKKNFDNCYKRHNENYVQWMARARTNLEYYLESRKVTNFNDLKELILADKIKDSLGGNLKSHILIKEGTNWLKPWDLAKEIDLYVETLPQANSANSYRDRADKNRGEKFTGRSTPEFKESAYQMEGSDASRTQNNGEKIFNDPGREKAKIKCFLCGGRHYRNQCTEKKEEQEKGERRVSCIQAKFGLNGMNAGEQGMRGRREKELLPVVNLSIAGIKIQAVRDSGAEISVFRKDLIPQKFLTGGHMYLVPAIGERRRANLVTLPIALWEERQIFSSEIDIIAAVTEDLNCPALITPSDYNALIKHTKLYNLKTGLGNFESQQTTGREGSSESNHVNSEKEIPSNPEKSSKMGPSKHQGLPVVEEIKEKENFVKNPSNSIEMGGIKDGESKELGTQPQLFRKPSWEGEMVIPEGIGNSLVDYLEKLKNDLRSTAEFASKIADKKQSDYAKRCNLRSSDRTFSVGDKVIVLIPDSTNKVYSRWIGPGVITVQKNKNSFFVQLPDGSVKNLYQNKLRPYIQAVNTIGLAYEADEDFGEIQHAPGENNIDKDKEYKINILEKLNHLSVRKKKQLKEILGKHKDIFWGEIKRPKVGCHAIRLKPNVERKQPHIYRVPEVLKPAVEDQKHSVC